MPKQIFIAVLTLLALLGWHPPTTAGQAARNERHQLVEQAWQAVNDSYFDTRFNGLDWPQARQGLLRSEYANQQAAYKAIRDLLAQLNEPATRFLTAEQFAALLGEFTADRHIGVGLIELLSADLHDQTRRFTVITPVPNSPALQAGLRPGDVIESVNGRPTDGLGLADAMSLLRGPDGTTVKVTIGRNAKRLTLNLPRRSVQLPNPPVQVTPKHEQGKRFLYIRLEQFTQNSGKEMRQAITHHLDQSVFGLVLDLRNNPGGAVSACQEVAGIFLGARPIAQVIGRNHSTTNLMAQGDKLTDLPVAVLVNEGSASAAEVIAGALQCYLRGIVVGTRTFGKGLVHRAQALADGSALMITTGRMQTPKGRDILIQGIQPDYLIAMSESPLLNPKYAMPASTKDRQYTRAIAKLIATTPLSDASRLQK